MDRDDFEIHFEPLTAWPLPDTNPRRNPQFRAGYDQTLKELRVEMRALEVSGPVVVQVVTRNGRTDLRRDGMLMARAQVIHPGVRLSFESAIQGSLTYSGDEFENTYVSSTPDWQANLRGIVKGLEALRAVRRYGIGGHGEQYRGWQQIAAQTGSTGQMDYGLALSVLAEESGIPIKAEAATPANLQPLVKLAKKNAHPDANRGAPERWNALTRALEALDLQ